MIGEAWPIVETELLTNICDYFKTRTDSLNCESMIWGANIIPHSEIIVALRNRDINFLHENFSNLFKSSITHGTVQGNQAFQYYNTNSPEPYIFSTALLLLEMLGYIRASNPEQSVSREPNDLDSLLSKIPYDITAPALVGGLHGTQTKFGLFEARTLISLGVAIIITNLFPNKDIKICEIGGGVGHLAYYLYKFGYKDITIVDLPTISVSQMYFLGTSLGKNHGIKLVPPSAYDGEFDLIVNVDSMPEMSRSSAESYCDKMKNTFLSINHESHSFTVSDVCKLHRLLRAPFWVRPGYVIELFSYPLGKNNC